jgi:hypothetical protein
MGMIGKPAIENIRNVFEMRYVSIQYVYKICCTVAVASHRRSEELADGRQIAFAGTVVCRRFFDAITRRF